MPKLTNKKDNYYNEFDNQKFSEERIFMAVFNNDINGKAITGTSAADSIYNSGYNDLLQITGKFSASYSKAKSEVYFKVGSTAKAIILHDFTATNFHVNSSTYKISNSKLVKQ